MPRYGCSKGCKPGFGAKAKWHDNPALCDYEPSYDPNARGACNCRGLATKKLIKPPETAPATTKPESTAPAPSQPPKPSGGSRLVASERAAEVVSVKKIIQPPQATEFIVDQPHTIRGVNFGFGVLRFAQNRIDDFFEVKFHIPAGQLRLSKNGEDTINQDPRSFYTKGITRLCVYVGCRTQQQAHAAIDTVTFFGEFGGYFVVLFEHNMRVYKESPKLIRGREKKKVEVEAKRLARMGAITTMGHEVAEAAA